jgi:hypothetical protein
MPERHLTPKQAYQAVALFLEEYRQSLAEAATLRRYMALPSETADTPALWPRWTACIQSVLSTPHPPRRRAPPDDPTSW